MISLLLCFVVGFGIWFSLLSAIAGNKLLGRIVSAFFIVNAIGLFVFPSFFKILTLTWLLFIAFCTLVVSGIMIFSIIFEK